MTRNLILFLKNWIGQVGMEFLRSRAHVLNMMNSVDDPNIPGHCLQNVHGYFSKERVYNSLDVETYLWPLKMLKALEPETSFWHVVSHAGMPLKSYYTSSFHRVKQKALLALMQIIKKSLSHPSKLNYPLPSNILGRTHLLLNSEVISPNFICSEQEKWIKQH